MINGPVRNGRQRSTLPRVDLGVSITHGCGEGADSIHKAPRQVQPQQLEGDCVEDDNEEDRDEDVGAEEQGQDGDGYNSIAEKSSIQVGMLWRRKLEECRICLYTPDSNGVEWDGDNESPGGEAPLLAIVEVDDGLEEGDEGEGEAGGLDQPPVPADGALGLQEGLPLLGVVGGEVVDGLGEGVDEHPSAEDHQGEHHLPRRRHKPLEAPEVHGLPLAGGVAGAEGEHDHGEERVDHEVDPVCGVPPTAALVEAALVDLHQEVSRVPVPGLTSASSAIRLGETTSTRVSPPPGVGEVTMRLCLRLLSIIVWFTNALQWPRSAMNLITSALQ